MKTDPTIQCLESIQKFADEHGAIVDRVEVSLRNGLVAFTGHLLPKPLAASTCAVCYTLEPAVAQ